MCLFPNLLKCKSVEFISQRQAVGRAHGVCFILEHCISQHWNGPGKWLNTVEPPHTLAHTHPVLIRSLS